MVEVSPLVEMKVDIFFLLYLYPMHRRSAYFFVLPSKTIHVPPGKSLVSSSNHSFDDCLWFILTTKIARWPAKATALAPLTFPKPAVAKIELLGVLCWNLICTRKRELNLKRSHFEA